MLALNTAEMLDASQSAASPENHLAQAHACAFKAAGLNDSEAGAVRKADGCGQARYSIPTTVPK